MASITGLGGAFVRVDDQEALVSWYEQHLGLTGSGGSFSFAGAELRGPVVLAFLGRDDPYFPPAQPVMLNLQVDDLDGMLDRLTEEGVAVDPDRQTHGYGRFGWFTDPAGNRVELWQPA